MTKDQRHKYHHLTKTLHLTQKITTTQVVETSVTGPDDHTRQTTDTPGFKSFTNISLINSCQPKKTKKTAITTFCLFVCLFVFLELASGGCMGVFRWSSGGQYRGKPWQQDLPADSQVSSFRGCRGILPLSLPKVNLTKPRKLLNPELSNET